MVNQKQWKKDEDDKMIEVVGGDGENANWHVVADKLRGFGVEKDADQCKRRYVNHLKPGINKDRMTLSEVQKLFMLFKTHGPMKDTKGRLKSRRKYCPKACLLAFLKAGIFSSKRASR